MFGKCYELASLNPLSKTAYLECLEPFVLNDQLRTMPPTIAKEFITHFDEIGNLKVIIVLQIIVSLTNIMFGVNHSFNFLIFL